MSWVKLDDQFTDHPKVVKAGPMASWLFVCGLAYCGRFLTDGAIPKEQVRRLADIDDPMTHAAKLVSVGLWHETEDGFQVNDYLDYNPAGEKVRAERSAAKERMSRHRSPEPEKRSSEVQPNNPRSSSSPSPSPSPDPDPSPPAGGVTREPNAEAQAGQDFPAPPRRFLTRPGLPIPTETECRNYFEAKAAGPLAEKFWTHYESVGWVIQGNPLTDWQARARQWIAEEATYPRARNGGRSSPPVAGQMGLTLEDRAQSTLDALKRAGL